MIEKFFRNLLCDKCDHCDEKKWKVTTERKHTYRGTLVSHTCEECEKKLRRLQKEQMVKKSAFNEETRRNWF